MILLTKEESEQKVCYICKNGLSTDDDIKNTLK